MQKIRIILIFLSVPQDSSCSPLRGERCRFTCEINSGSVKKLVSLSQILGWDNIFTKQGEITGEKIIFKSCHFSQKRKCKKMSLAKMQHFSVNVNYSLFLITTAFYVVSILYGFCKFLIKTRSHSKQTRTSSMKIS